MYQTIQNQTKPNLPIPNQAKLPAGPLSNVTCYFEKQLSYGQYMEIWFGLVWLGLVWF